MPFLLWVVYPYTIWMGCCSLVLERNQQSNDGASTPSECG
jgi:hypothetical protein